MYARSSLMAASISMLAGDLYCLYAGTLSGPGRQRGESLGARDRAAVAGLAFSQRDLIPDVISVLVGNFLICLAYAEYPRALRVFHAGDATAWPTPRWIAAFVIVPVVLYTWVTPSVPLRTVTTSAVVMALLLFAARETVRAAPRPWPTSHVITLTIFAGGAALLFVRIVFETLNPQPLTSGVAATPMRVATFSYMSLVPVIATFGFALMCSEYHAPNSNGSPRPIR